MTDDASDGTRDAVDASDGRPSGADGPPEPFRTVAERASADVEVRGSEFVGYVAPVADEAAAEAFVEEVAGEHPDATHVVPAYRVRTGEGYLREFQSDDAEPSGSAGTPALNVLQGRELENVAVAIARYFGGTELGVGGLVSAYGRTAADAVDAAGVVEREPRAEFLVRVEYDDSGSVRSVLESAEADLGAEFEAAYEADVLFEVSVPVAEAEDLRDRLLSATSGRADVE